MVPLQHGFTFDLLKIQFITYDASGSWHLFGLRQQIKFKGDLNKKEGGGEKKEKKKKEGRKKERQKEKVQEFPTKSPKRFLLAHTIFLCMYVSD